MWFWGNPPWERIKLQEKEWFAPRNPDIAQARNAAARKRMINQLKEKDPMLHAAFLEDKRKAEGESHLVRNSGRFPLCGRGDVNTYSVFAETKRMILSPKGRVGCIVPSGIATDDTTKFFFQDLVEGENLVSLYDFENKGMFPGVHGSYKFCLLTLTGLSRPASKGAEFAFFLHDTSEIRDEKCFGLTSEDIALINPNTRTCPIFRTRRDAELTKAIYRRVPVLIREDSRDGNPWGVKFLRMIDMANHSSLFRTREQLETDDWILYENVFIKEDHRCLPLYEGKMIWQYDHRFGTYENYQSGSTPTKLETPDISKRNDPHYGVIPRYWIHEEQVSQIRMQINKRGWILSYRRITNSTNERTSIFSIVPFFGLSDGCPIIITNRPAIEQSFLLANMNSFVADFIVRKKIGGLHLDFHQLRQCVALNYSQVEDTVSSLIMRIVLELTYTAWDLQPFALDCGYHGPPFRWDEDRRFLLRCELDAAYFHLYGIDRDDADYIMETFPIVRRKDEQKHGEYRTKRMILEIYDEMAEAVQTGEPYQTRIDPPPADPEVAHPPLSHEAGT